MAIGMKIVDGDFVILNKNIVFIQDNEKLLRDFRKFLLTETETDNNITTYSRYNPKYGTSINNKALYINMSSSSIIDLINQNLSANIQYYVALQEGRNNLSLGEMITNIEFMAYVDPTDKRVIQIPINVITPKNGALNVGTFSQTIV